MVDTYDLYIFYKFALKKLSSNKWNELVFRVARIYRLETTPFQCVLSVSLISNLRLDAKLNSLKSRRLKI